MKRVICDQCRKEELPSTYGLAPDGWFTVDKRGDFSAGTDLCSVACLIAKYTPLLPASPQQPVLEDSVDRAERALGVQ